ncbi:MAG: hypothetical protein JXA25_10040 [Anaerolineales bacterium]|nr:hypothetical protein [Anaerolineales bacterium]
MGTENQMVTAHAPGRICLLGDNVDLIEEPVLAAAISAFLTVTLLPRADRRIRLTAADIGFREEFELGDTPALTSPLRYLEAIILRLQPYITTGFEASIHSEIPVSAGMSSSTALCIGFLRALNQAFHIGLDTAEIAELSYRIEREDLNIECGRMDQYAIAFGGVTFIHTGDLPSVENIPVQSLPVVVADTQESHNTQELQLWLQDRLRANDPVLVQSLQRVTKMVSHGRQALLDGDLVSLGKLMNQQQLEENIMGTATERLNLFCETARQAGAWGVKQMGAGGGGCAIALCPPDSLVQVQDALKTHHAPVWIFEIYRNQ